MTQDIVINNITKKNGLEEHCILYVDNMQCNNDILLYRKNSILSEKDKEYNSEYESISHTKYLQKGKYILNNLHNLDYNIRILTYIIISIIIILFVLMFSIMNFYTNTSS
jgi:hypothetical protein